MQITVIPAKSMMTSFYVRRASRKTWDHGASKVGCVELKERSEICQENMIYCLNAFFTKLHLQSDNARAVKLQHFNFLTDICFFFSKQTGLSKETAMADYVSLVEKLKSKSWLFC